MSCVARNVDVSILRIVIIGDTTGLAGDTSKVRSLIVLVVRGRGDRLTGKLSTRIMHEGRRMEGQSAGAPVFPYDDSTTIAERQGEST